MGFLGARLFGRWKSGGLICDVSYIVLIRANPGAPIDRDPNQDNLADANDPNKVNDFDYSDDPGQIKCPFSAHLRKTNPRNGVKPGLAGVQVRRIIRQSIPYGPEVTPAEAASATTQINRGLLFVRNTISWRLCRVSNILVLANRAVIKVIFPSDSTLSKKVSPIVSTTVTSIHYVTSLGQQPRFPQRWERV